MASASQSAGQWPGFDPPGLVPTDPEEISRALDRALPEEIDGEPLEEGSKLARWLGPGNRKLLHPWVGHFTQGTPAAIQVAN